MTTLRLFNTLTKSKEDFVPIDPGNVRMYVCGPTVYDYAHIGNARPVIVFDVLFRLLRHVYGADHVTYVRNITDVDDKINVRAAERHISIRELTDETYAQYKSDVTALGCLPPSEEPRATDYIEVMKEIIEKLRENQHAYVENEHVLFSVPSMPSYGELSKRPLDEMIAGARIDVAPYKRNPMDFVLWKPSDKRSNVSLPSWTSPAGIETPGRPGWHLECSAMSWAKLGQVFDIHGGGIDLIFPHHENEIAQSRCAFHTSFLAKYWMHNGFLEVEGAKMSKSLGNFVTINDLLNTEKFGGRSWTGGVLRFAMLKTHYRQPIDWTLRALEEAQEELSNWANAISNSNVVANLIGRQAIGAMPNPSADIVEALSDDLNMSKVLTVMREYFVRYTKGNAQAALELAEACDFLGLINLEKLFVYNPYYVGSGPKLLPPHLKKDMREVQVAYANSNPVRIEILKGALAREGVSITIMSNGGMGYEVDASVAAIDTAAIERAIEARLAARKAKDFKESDRIRDELLAQGIVLKDSPTGTTWEVKK